MKGVKWQTVGFLHADRTYKGLKELKLDFTYDSKENTPIEVKEVHYSGAIRCKDPHDIASFLITICKLTRNEVALFIDQNGLKDSPFGQEIIQEAEKPLEGVEDKNLRVLFEKNNDFDLNKTQIDHYRITTMTIPDLPKEARNIDISKELKKAFNDHIGGIMINKLNDKYSRKKLEDGIHQLISVAHGANWAGLPKDEKEREVFHKKMQFYLRHIIHLLQYGDTFLKESQIAQLAIGGISCAGGHIQGIIEVFNALRFQAPISLYHDANALGAHLSITDQNIVEFIDLMLRGLRKSVFDNLVEEIHKSNPTADWAHTRNMILKKIGKERDIPGMELSNYKDPYKKFGVGEMTQDFLLKKFDEKYTPQLIVETLEKDIRYGGRGAKIMDQLVDFFNHHAPLKYHTDLAKQTNESFFGDEVVTEDLLGIKHRYFVQMLIITKHLKYNSYHE